MLELCSIDTAYNPFLTGEGVANVFSDPVFIEKVSLPLLLESNASICIRSPLLLTRLCRPFSTATGRILDVPT